MKLSINPLLAICFMAFCLMFLAKMSGIAKLDWIEVFIPMLIPIATRFFYSLMQLVGLTTSEPKI